MSDMIAVGQIVLLTDGRRAVVRFVGQTHFADGDWVGLELEDDSGKNDGSVKGERYFDCEMGRGMFVRPSTMTIVEDAPPPVPALPKPSAAALNPLGRRASRPSLATASTRPTSVHDPTMARRVSINAASPSPAARRPSSLIARSPSKSPTKQLGLSASTSSAIARSGNPPSSRVSSVGARPRPSSNTATRGSMGPPALPASSRPGRQSSSSSSVGRGAGTTRALGGGRLTTAGRGPTVRPARSRDLSGESHSGDPSSANRSGGDSPAKSDEANSPVRTRTNALEKATPAGGSGPRAGSTRTSIAAASSSSPRTAGSNAVSRENEDLKTKLKVLERKRLEDREKLQEIPGLQEKIEKLSVINKKIEGKFQSVTQEVISLRKQVKESEGRLETVEALQAEHESVMELATLDREMAEETAEVMKVELEALKQKNEELELEVEVLREENAEYDKGMSAEDRAITNWIQMERQNERLREALIKLRDLSQEQDEDSKARIKDLRADLEDFDTIKEQYEVSKAKLAQAEARAADLSEQLDNALGAEDMIEQLTEDKMNQGERIKELEAAIDDLEALKEINDELEVNHVQNEKEMQQELDFKDSVIAEQARRAGQQEETMEDMEYTLSRFRELVTNLQTDLEDIRASHAVNEAESEQLSSKSRAMMDLNLKLQLSAAKTQVKTIDLELQRMDAQEAQQHLQIVKLFLPESYETDKNSVLALLRFKRLAFKANLLYGFVKERVGKVQAGHEDDVFAGCDALDKLTWVSCMCDRFVNAISHCSLEEFAKYEGALFELEPVERALNGWIDGLRREELKEKQCAAELSRTIALMTHLAEVHISGGLGSFADHVQMKTLLMQGQLESAATAFAVTKDMVKRTVQLVGEGEAEDDEPAQEFVKRAEAVISQTRSAKVVVGKAVRSLEDLKARHLCLTPETADVFDQCEATAQELANMSRQIGLELHVLTAEEGRAEPLTYSDVQNTVCHTAATSSSSGADTELFSSYMSKLRLLTSQISDLAAVCADLSQTHEFERSEAPWRLRAEEMLASKTIPVDTEEELRQLKEHYNTARRTIAQREDEMGTAKLRIETLEARMKDASAKAARITDLELQISAAQEHITKLKDDMDKQDRELKALETERDKWKKMASESQSFGDAAGAAGAKAGQDRAVATAREMDALKDDTARLQAAVRFLREDNGRARLKEQSSYGWLAEPLKKTPALAAQRKARVLAEGKDVLGELVRMAGSAKVYDLSAPPQDRMAWRPARTSPQYHAARQAEDFAGWRSWQQAVLQKARVVLNAQSGKRPEWDQDRIRRAAAARLQIRLPDADGKVIVGSGLDVAVVGAAEWEGLQGRVGLVQ